MNDTKPYELAYNITAYCGMPQTHNSMNYSSYNSTLEGSTVSFWCTDVPFQPEEFTITMGFGSLHLILRRDALCFQHQVKISSLDNKCFTRLLFKGSEGLSQEGKISVASSVTVFTVVSILFFIVGFLCGHFCQKNRKSSTAAGETVPPAGSGGT
jgi:hypothetical protein